MYTNIGERGRKQEGNWWSVCERKMEWERRERRSVKEGKG